VNWAEISRGASTATNYQIMPRDRIYICEDPFFRFGTTVNKIIQPFERMLGFVSLGTATLNQIKRFGLGSLN
jgi:hypothetical protein